MTPEQIDHVFGRGRLKMETGAHVEVFREAAAPGESRRYTKRFLTTADGDYAQWTEREWRILARLIGHGSRCVPDVVQYDRDARGTKLVQTYDAGATVDQWATFLPVERDGRVYARVFEDCAHWWALAHHCLVALDEIHTLQLVHLDVKGDNICIPIGPANFNHAAQGQRLFPVFRKLTLIDFAFSLVSGENLTTPLPIGWQQDYDYQSPRLLHALEAGRAGDVQPTEDLDWRCDMYSLAAMLKRYLPGEHRLHRPELACGWTEEHYDAAKALILRIRETHDRDLTFRRPHSELIMETSAHVRANKLARSLDRGWTLAHDAQPVAVPILPLTPVTRLAPSIRLAIPPRDDLIALRPSTRARGDRGGSKHSTMPYGKVGLLAAAASMAAIGIVPFFTDVDALWADATQRVSDDSRAVSAAVRGMFEPDAVSDETTSSQPVADQPKGTSSPTATDTGALAHAAGTAEPEATAGEATEAGRETSTSAARSQVSVASTESAQSPPSSESSQSAQSLPLSQSEPSERSPMSSAPDSTPAPEVLPSSPSTLPPASQARLTGDSQASRTESYRSKPVPRSSRIARTPSSSASTAARALPLQPAGSTPRTQVAGTNKSSRSSTSVRAVASRSQQPLASKRSGSATLVASRTPSRTPPTTVAASATATSLAAVAPAATAPTEAMVASVTPSEAATGTVTVAQNATPASPAPGVAAFSPPSQAAPELRVAATPPTPAAGVTPQLAPSVETPRAMLTPMNAVASAPRMAPPVETPRATPVPTNPVAGTPGMAPVVEASRPLTTPAIQLPRPLTAPVIQAPRPLAAAVTQAPRPLAAAVTQAPGPYVAPPVIQAPRPFAGPMIQAPRQPAPPVVEASRARPSPAEAREDAAYLAEARRTLADTVPRSSTQSRAQIERVLWIAANAYHPAQERAVIAAANSPGAMNDVAFVTRELAPGDARRLHEEARQAYWSRRDVPDALDLELKAFGANPNDPEIAGHLAFLYLKVFPAQPERARQLALHAIGIRNTQYQTGHSEDWTTFAIASALTGRGTDAKHALYVSVALARNVDRVCRAALGALALYGERVREPVEALLYRLRAQGRADDSPYCAWPPNRMTGYP